MATAGNEEITAAEMKSTATGTTVLAEEEGGEEAGTEAGGPVKRGREEGINCNSTFKGNDPKWGGGDRDSRSWDS